MELGFCRNLIWRMAVEQIRNTKEEEEAEKAREQEEEGDWEDQEEVDGAMMEQDHESGIFLDQALPFSNFCDLKTSRQPVQITVDLIFKAARLVYPLGAGF